MGGVPRSISDSISSSKVCAKQSTYYTITILEPFKVTLSDEDKYHTLRHILIQSNIKFEETKYEQ